MERESRHACQLWVSTRQHDAQGPIFLEHSGGSFWQAELVCRFPAEHAAIALDQNGVRITSRERNHPFIPEGLHVLQR